MRLLDRTTRHVRLTTVGRQFLPESRRLIQELEHLLTNVKDAANIGAGQVTFACIPTAATYLLPTVMKEYSAKYPRNRIRILDCRAHEAVQALRNGEAEFAITLRTGSQQDLELEVLFDDPFVLACRRDHPLARQKQVEWANLEHHQVIGVGRLSGNYPSLDVAPSVVVHGQWHYEVQQSFTTGLDLAETGMGAIVVPRLALLRTKHPTLISRPLVKPSIVRTICIARRRDTTLSPAASHVLSLLRKRWMKT